MKKENVGFRIFVIVCAVLVPALFVLNAIQADRYMKVQNEIKVLEQKQASDYGYKPSFKRRKNTENCGRRAWHAQGRV